MAASKRLKVAGWADHLRALFDRLADRHSPVTVVLFLAMANAVTVFAMNRFEQAACGRLPFSMLDLELTFSAGRFDTLLRRITDAECGSFVLLNLVTLDVVYPLAYGLGLSGLFLWTERHRRRHADNTHDARALPARNHVLVLLPIAAALLDILGENIPLLLAALLLRSGVAPAALLVSILVVIGSLAAALKFSLLLVVFLFIVSELFSRSRGRLLRRLRFSVIAVLLGAFPLLLVPQGQEILQRLVEGSSPEGRIIGGLIALTFAATAVWYCGRKLAELRFSRETSPSDPDWYEFFAENLPRMLGIAVLALAGAAFARVGAALGWFVAAALLGYVVTLFASRRMPQLLRFFGRPFIWSYWKEVPRLDERVGRVVLASIAGVLALGDPLRLSGASLPLDLFRLRIAAWACLIVAWLFYLYVYSRRERIAARRYRRMLLPVVEEQLAISPPRAPLDPEADIYRNEVRHLEREAVASVDAWTAVHRLRWGIAATVAASIVMLVLFAVRAVELGRFLGALVILAMTVSIVVFYGSIAAWVFGTYRIALASLVFILAALFSLWNDSHVIRTLKPVPAEIAARRDIAAHLAEWRRARPADGAPLILVAAAGGGLRAAYWTAASLGALQDRNAAFSTRVFAISGVSGGSLGAAVFTALVRDAQGLPEIGRRADRLPCVPRAMSDTMTARTFGKYSACVRLFMRDDFLSPVLAKMAGPDLLQWFLPFPVKQFDRSLALEGAWEQSYRNTTGRTTMAEGILALTRDSANRTLLPALFLSATHVESGRRYIASPLVRSGQNLPAGHPSRAMRDSRDLIDLLGSDIRVSTAVGNSARFTYVSPPGRIERNDGAEYGHLVDGAYFENSALVTLREVLEIVLESDSAATVVQPPIVLYLCNDPLGCRRSASEDTVLTTRRSAIVEWAAPVRALFRTRDARGSLARADIATRRDIRFVQLNVCDSLVARGGTAADSAILGSKERQKLAEERVVAPPLGWILSKAARDWMDSSLTRGAITSRPSRCRRENVAALDMLDSLLTPSLRNGQPAAAVSHPISGILR